MCPPDLEQELSTQMDRINTFDLAGAYIHEVVNYRQAVRATPSRGLALVEANEPECYNSIVLG